MAENPAAAATAVGTSTTSTIGKGDSTIVQLSSGSKEDFVQAKHRLQKQKAQNRRSFRLRKSQKAVDKSLLKSESIDIGEDIKLRQQLNSLKPSEVSFSSAGQLPDVGGPPGDTNGNVNSDKVLKTSLDSQLNNNNDSGTNNNPAIITTTTTSSTTITTTTTSNNNNNTADYPMRVISDLGLSGLNRRSVSDNSTTLSPFEATLSTLPFADEEV